MSTLQTRKICVRFPGNAEPLFQEITMSISKGEFVGIIGPNGSGKSTLVRVLSRTLPPEAGAVLLDQEDLYHEVSARASAQNIAVVPQDTAISFDFSVREVVEMGRGPHLPRRPFAGLQAEDHAAVSHSLKQVGAEALASRSVSTLSGGERQRALLARALAQETQVLLLDEPTAHLDLGHQAEVLGLAQDLAHSHGKSVLAVLHDLNLAAFYCDRLILLNNGRIAADGTPSAVLTSEMLHSVYGINPWIRRHPMTERPYFLPVPKVRSSLPRDLIITVLCGAGTGSPLLAQLQAQGYQVQAGGLHEGDPDAETADVLKIHYSKSAPFASFPPGLLEQVQRQALQADIVVLSEVPIGPMNIGLLQTALHAAKQGVPVICLLSEATPFAARDHTDGQAAFLWQELMQAKAHRVDSLAAALEWIHQFWEYNRTLS